MIQVCQVCSKEFVTKPSLVKRGWGKYCSRKCQWESYKVIPEAKKCLRCGKEFLVGGATGKGRRRRSAQYCSRACGNRGIERPRNMSETERAWFAGIFDGEGSIIQYKPHGIQGQQYWRIQVANTVKELIDRVAEVTGIANVSARPIPINKKHKQCFNWQAHGENAELILRQILPWLIVKREKALNLITLEQT